MKKVKRVIVSALTAVLALLVACAFAACNNDSGEKNYNGTYTGEYHYNQYGTEYGVKVEVTVENNVIKSVKPVASDYVEASDSSGKWVKETWTDNAASVYAKYEGKTVAEVKAIKVIVEDSGAPKTGESYSGLVHSGATLSSGRFLLAVQNALK